MALREAHPRADLLRYLDGAASSEEQQALEAHLVSCKECREYVAFARRFNNGLGELTEDEFTSAELCPDSPTLVAYEAGEVDEETARHLRAHLLFCDECQEEFYALRRLRGPSWTKAIVRAVRGGLELLTVAGSGNLLEPAYAPMRAEEAEGRAEPIRIEDTVVDPETKATATVRVNIEAEPKAPAASVRVQAEPPQPDWKAYLLDAEDEERSSAPLAAGETAIGANLPYGSYTVSIRRGPETLASFAIEVRGA